MTINYPNGMEVKKLNKLKENRGMLFEHELNETNKYYLLAERAVIYKKPTPVQIVRVEYPKRQKAKIVEAYYQAPSTTDYNGIYKKRYIDYEAKQTNSSSFSFENISPHQIKHLLLIDKQGGIAFVIIYFKTLEKVYIIDIKDFYKYYDLAYNDKDARKSLKASDIESIGGVEVEISYSPRIKYLDAVDKLYF